MTHLPPSFGEDPRPTHREASTPGPTLQGDQNLLSGAALGAPPMEVIMSRYAPAELALEGVPYEDACRVIAETLLPDEDFALTPTQLRAYMELTRRGQPLDRIELEELAPEVADLVIRQLLTIGSHDRKLIEQSSLEFSLSGLNERGCSIDITPNEASGLCDITLDWCGSLSYQSDHSLGERWDLVQQILLVAGDIDAATCRTRTLDSAVKRFQLEDRATLEVVARDIRSASPSTDPHLSQRADLIPLCALRLHDEEEYETGEDIAERFIRIHAELSKVCSGLRNEFNLEEAMVSRSQLEQLGDAPYLWNSPTEVLIINVERYLLVVTKASTGNTLLEDIQALDRYAAEKIDDESSPTLGALRAIEATAASEEGLAPVFESLALPGQTYFVEALRQFVESENPEARVRIRDGLLDSVLAGESVTVELSRNFFIAGKEFEGILVTLDEDQDEETADSVKEEAENEQSEEEESVLESWADSESQVTVSRTALVVPGSGSTHSGQTLVGFVPPRDSNTPGEDLTESRPLFFLTVSVDEGEIPVLPSKLAAATLQSLGVDPDDLTIIASRPGPVSGQREGYLSKSVRVVY